MSVTVCMLVMMSLVIQLTFLFVQRNMVCDAMLVFDVIIKTWHNVKAQTYEVLREHGISHCTPHPVLLTQTRSCPLQLPPPAEKIPAWKTVRPRKQLEESQVEENREIFLFCCVV